MLRQHRVDIERAADVVGRINRADLDMRLVACGEHRAKVVGSDRKHLRARDREAGDASAEVGQPADRIARAFAEEVDAGDQLARLLGAQGADVGDQEGAADDHLDLASDLAGHGDRRIGIALKLGDGGRVHANAGAGTGDLDDFADRRKVGGLRPGSRRCTGLIAEAVNLVDEIPQVRMLFHSALQLTLTRATAVSASG